MFFSAYARLSFHLSLPDRALLFLYRDLSIELALLDRALVLDGGLASLKDGLIRLPQYRLARTRLESASRFRSRLYLEHRRAEDLHPQGVDLGISFQPGQDAF